MLAVWSCLDVGACGVELAISEGNAGMLSVLSVTAASREARKSAVSLAHSGKEAANMIMVSISHTSAMQGRLFHPNSIR